LLVNSCSFPYFFPLSFCAPLVLTLWKNPSLKNLGQGCPFAVSKPRPSIPEAHSTHQNYISTATTHCLEKQKTKTVRELGVFRFMLENSFQV
jgi:hypothetical protein